MDDLDGYTVEEVDEMEFSTALDQMESGCQDWHHQIPAGSFCSICHWAPAAQLDLDGGSVPYRTPPELEPDPSPPERPAVQLGLDVAVPVAVRKRGRGRGRPVIGWQDPLDSDT